MTWWEPLYEIVFWVRAKGLNYSIRLPVPLSNVFLGDKNLNSIKNISYIIKVKDIFCVRYRNDYTVITGRELWG